MSEDSTVRASIIVVHDHLETINNIIIMLKHSERSYIAERGDRALVPTSLRQGLLVKFDAALALGAQIQRKINSNTGIHYLIQAS